MIKMVTPYNSTAFPDPYGWNQIVNESSFNPINASITALQSSGGGGLAWIVATIFIIFLVPFGIYVKSQNMLAAVFGQVMITLLMNYYGYLHPLVYWPSYVSCAIMVALTIGYKIFAKR